MIIRRRETKNKNKNGHKADLSQTIGLPVITCIRELFNYDKDDTRTKKLIFIANISPNVNDIKQTENTLSYIVPIIKGGM